MISGVDPLLHAAKATLEEISISEAPTSLADAISSPILALAFNTNDTQARAELQLAIRDAQQWMADDADHRKARCLALRGMLTVSLIAVQEVDPQHPIVATLTAICDELLSAFLGECTPDLFRRARQARSEAIAYLESQGRWP